MLQACRLRDARHLTKREHGCHSGCRCTPVPHALTHRGSSCRCLVAVCTLSIDTPLSLLLSRMLTHCSCTRTHVHSRVLALLMRTHRTPRRPRPTWACLRQCAVATQGVQPTLSHARTTTGWASHTAHRIRTCKPCGSWTRQGSPSCPANSAHLSALKAASGLTGCPQPSNQLSVAYLAAHSSRRPLSCTTLSLAPVACKLGM